MDKFSLGFSIDSFIYLCVYVIWQGGRLEPQVGVDVLEQENSKAGL